MPSKISQLVKECHKLFACTQPGFWLQQSEGQRQSLLSVVKLLNNIGPQDLGIDQRTFFDNKPPLATHCQAVYRSSQFEVNAFFIPKHSRIPLHNHPKMIVCCKVLFGEAHVIAYDWKGKRTEPNGSRLASKSVDTILTPDDDVYTLFPKEGNIHTITAVKPCAFLDILLPPYKPPERDCTYYKPKELPDTFEDEPNIYTPDLELEDYDPLDFAGYSDRYKDF
jgi:hypothetical protein